jgi:CheY-like chemotaxis protein
VNVINYLYLLMRRHVECLADKVMKTKSENIAITKSNSLCSSFGGDMPLRALIVDDAPLCRTMLKRILQNECSVIDEACDGAEAVRKVTESMKFGRPYDIVIMDGNMPKMGGLEATSILREHGFKGDIVGCTGDVFPEEINNFKSHGADIVIVKPIELKTLNAHLEGLRNRKAQSRVVQK